MELIWDWLLAICHFKNKLKSHGKYLIAVLRIVCFKVDRLPFLSFLINWNSLFSDENSCDQYFKINICVNLPVLKRGP